MDLGLRGKTALVCGASKGLGKACALSLAREGVQVTIVSRSADNLAQAAADILARTGATVQCVAADVTTAEGRSAALAACPQPDILVTNAGGPPPGDFRKLTLADWDAALNANMLSPIELIKAVIDPMIARRFGRIINITSSSVKAPIEVLGLSNGARSGLTGFVAGLARQTVRHNVTINNLLPGVFNTDRIRTTAQAMASKQGQSLEETLAARAKSIPAGRLGEPYEFGQACAYLCSGQASYVTGQNFLIDGGTYPGTY